MKVSRNWLQAFFNDPLPSAQELADALTFHAFEIEEVVNSGSDDILDVKVTPNRGHDCLSHRGIARELSAILMKPVKEDPLRVQINLEPPTDAVSVSIAEPTLCRRYIAGYIRGVKVGPSPEWLKNSLEAVGQRSINNVVDATNYVMFNLGQPLHAFDAGQLRAENGAFAIEVRKAKAGENMIALDDKEYTLADTMLVIADKHVDAAIGIAGVKGGKPAGITETTKDIIIESANFDGVCVRRTATALKLRTDASSRFEQVISPELAAYGMYAAAKLIVELAGGEVVGFVDEYPLVAEKKQTEVTTAFVNATLGTELQDTDIEAALTRLDLAHVQEGGKFVVNVPFERLDILIPEDLVEEIARIAGYDKIPAVELPKLSEPVAVNTNFYWTDRICEFLIGRGFSEIFTSIFAEEGDRAVLNKVDSVRPYLRRDLLVGLREALDKNVRNKDLLGLRQVKLFEIGTRWSKDSESVILGIAVEHIKKEKSTTDFLRELGESLGVTIAEVIDLPAEALAKAGVEEIDLSALLPKLSVPDAYGTAPSSTTERYQPFSKYPFMVRDVALWTPSGTSPEDVLAVISAHAGELLVRSELFDRFEKEGKVSYAFRLIFQSFDKTLTDGDTNERMESIYTGLKEKGYEIR